MHTKMLNALVKLGKGLERDDMNYTARVFWQSSSTFPMNTVIEFRHMEIKIQESVFADAVVSNLTS